MKMDTTKPLKNIKSTLKNKIPRRLKKIDELPTGTVTALFIITIVTTYLYLAYSYLYIPGPQLAAYGFILERPLTALSYSFIHLSPQHILANVALLLAVGIVAEQKLKTKDYIAIFFASAATSGVVFHILTPEPTVLVGASSAVSGILAASIFIDIKKAIVAILIFTVFLNFTAPVVEQHTREKLGVLEQETQQIEEEVNKTEEKLNKTEEEINKTEEEADEIEKKINETEQEIGEKMTRIEYLEKECYEEPINETACEELDEIEEQKEQVEEELEEVEKGLEEKEEEIEEEKEKRQEITIGLNKTIERLMEKMQEKEVVEEGVEREERARTSSIVHLVGAITGLIYLGIFRRDIIWDLPSQVSQ